MKKNSLLFVSTIVALASLIAISCHKEEQIPTEKQQEEEVATTSGKQITITATIPDTPESRVAFEQATGKVKLTWEDGDKIIIVDEGNVMDKQTFSLSSGAGKATATFSGTEPANTSSTYTIFYAGNTEAYTTTDAVNNKSYADQVQVGNGNTDHLAFTAMLTNVNAYDHFVFSSDWASAHSGNLVINSIYKFYFKLPAAVTSVSEVRLNAPAAIFYTTNSNGSTTSEIGVSLLGVDVSTSEQVLTAYAMASDETVSMAAATYTVTVVGTSSSWVKQFTTASAGSFGGGKTHVVKLNDQNWTELPGKGTEEAPFLLDTPEELQVISPLLVENGAKRYFKLGGNVTYDSSSSTAFNSAGGLGKLFNAEFDGDSGNSRVVSGLNATSPLFTSISSGAVVKNLTLDNTCTFTFTHTPTDEAFYCGPIANILSGSVTGVTVNSNVNVTDATTTRLIDLGGLVGRANTKSALISNCSYNGKITMPSGYTTSSEIRIGGIVGCITEKSPVIQVKNSLFGGVIDCQGGNTNMSYDVPKVCIGGIVGSGAAAISNCSTSDAEESAKVSVTISETEYKSAIVVHPSGKYMAASVGGIVGYNQSAKGSVSSCNNYSTLLTYIPSASGDNVFLDSGGVVGHSAENASVSSCKNYGSITHISTSKTQHIGGVVGYDAGTLGTCYNESTGTLAVKGTPLELRLGGVIGEKAGGSVTASSIIRNRAGISVTAADASSTAYIGGVIGNNSVALDGIDAENSNITNNASITITPGIVTSAAWAVGGIVGYTSANLTKVSNNGGSISFIGKFSNGTSGTGSTKNAYVGGVLGLSNAIITLSGCKNAASVSYSKDVSTKTNGCPSYVGGIVGGMGNAEIGAGTISNCTSTGTVSNTNSNNSHGLGTGPVTGGIIGAIVGKSDQRGTISGVSVSYDTEKSGIYALRGDLGGVTGYASYTDINGTSCNVKITGAGSSTDYRAGGAIGIMVNSSLSNFAFSGTIAGGTGYMGGLVDNMNASSSIDNCTVNADITGGQAGSVVHTSAVGATITGCGVCGTINSVAMTTANSVTDYSNKATITGTYLLTP